MKVIHKIFLFAFPFLILNCAVFRYKLDPNQMEKCFRDIEPIIDEHCAQCHNDNSQMVSEKRRKSGLILINTYDKFKPYPFYLDVNYHRVVKNYIKKNRKKERSLNEI